MFYNVHSAVLNGIEAIIVNVEIDISKGIPVFEMTGSLATQVKEARERVRISIKNSGFSILPGRVTVNISPADIKKAGTLLDLPIAIGMLGTLGFINHNMIKDILVVGELSLDGHVGGVNGILPVTIKAKEKGYKRIIIPYSNMREASYVNGIEVIPVKTLRDAIDYLTGRLDIKPVHSDYIADDTVCDDDMIVGQLAAKRATLIAACGMHNIIYTGPPGVGKTMLARLLPQIMAPMTQKESEEISGVYSVCGLLDSSEGLLRKRPFRTPYHKITVTGLLGGGSNVTPGEVSLSTKGVLFLDELPLYSSQVLNALRVPLEDKKIHILRKTVNYTFPADFILAGAMNPCACGFYPDMKKCTCSPMDIKRYFGKLEKPFLDRIDISVEVPKVLINNNKETLDIHTMKSMILEGNKRQLERFKYESIAYNSQMDNALIEKYANLTKSAKDILDNAYERMELSMRAYNKIIKVGRTIADVCDSEKIMDEHIIEAISLRVQGQIGG